MISRRRLILAVSLGLYCGLFLFAGGVGSMAYFHFGNPSHTCASCHEMNAVHSGWSASAHRTLHCRNCHGGSLTLELHALESHANRVVQHFTGDPGKPIHLAEQHVLRAHESCRNCHPQSFADWQASRHSASYARIFLDETHNKTEQPASDCLRCHGMFFDDDIADLVTPLSKAGPWTLKDSSKTAQPTIPCLACHQIHAPAGELQSAKTHFYDRRERAYFPTNLLPGAAPEQDGHTVKVSADPRVRLCTQCHAPSAAHLLGSSDDRTPAGVHEGLSCLDCHQSHTNSAKASCSTCHPADSHCGLEVEKMDTTFRSTESRHNIHTVACRDCHPQGVPQLHANEIKRLPLRVRSRLSAAR